MPPRKKSLLCEDAAKQEEWAQVRCIDCRNLNIRDSTAYFCEAPKMTDKARPVFLVLAAANEVHECEHFGRKV